MVFRLLQDPRVLQTVEFQLLCTTAILHGRLPIVEHLLSEYNVDVNYASHGNNDIPLQLAVRQGDLRILKRILMDPNFRPTPIGAMKAMSMAIYRQSSNAVRMLLKSSRIKFTPSVMVKWSVYAALNERPTIAAVLMNSPLTEVAAVCASPKIQNAPKHAKLVFARTLLILPVRRNLDLAKLMPADVTPEDVKDFYLYYLARKIIVLMKLPASIPDTYEFDDLRIKAFKKLLEKDSAMNEVFELAGDWKTIELAANEVAQRELHKLFPNRADTFTIDNTFSPKCGVMRSPSYTTTTRSDFTELHIDEILE
jgi:hypothetical protein